MEKKRILFVDDETSLLRLIKMNLDQIGKYEVKTENFGTKALQTARTFKPDLIFLDIVMPDREGSEVAREIRADQTLRNVPIIFLTATITNEELGSSGGVIGGEAFLSKPISVKQLVECIESKLKS